MWNELMQKIVRFLDPRLEKYRMKRPEPEKPRKVEYVPKNLEDFVGIIRRAPKSVLSVRDRKRIAAVMSFDSRTVGELMVPKEKMIFVSEKEMLGPLMLDKLYKSGFVNFPIINAKEKVTGIINTEALNNLEVRKLEEAVKYADKKVRYLHMADSLKNAAEEIARTNGYYYLVLDERGDLVGFFTVQILLDYFIG